MTPAAWGKQQALQAHLASAQMEFKITAPKTYNNMWKNVWLNLKTIPPDTKIQCQKLIWKNWYKLNCNSVLILTKVGFVWYKIK